MSFEFESLDIRGHNNGAIPNNLLRQKRTKGPISIIFPGLRYSVDMPVLYYAAGILLEAGHSVLTVDTQYWKIEEFMSASDQERADWMFDDAEATYNAVQNLKGYDLSVIVGKSLGTIQMGHILNNHQETRDYKMFWCTPLLQHRWIVQQMISHRGRSLVVIGTADPHYDDDIVARLVEEGHCDIMAIMKGNHSLDVPGGVLDSMEQLVSIARRFKVFIQS